jgi:hypothetical protein
VDRKEVEARVRKELPTVIAALEVSFPLTLSEREGVYEQLFIGFVNGILDGSIPMETGHLQLKRVGSASAAGFNPRDN